MNSVVVSATNVVSFPEGGGHFWVFLQYVLGLRAIGCDVWWLERMSEPSQREFQDHRTTIFLERLASFGMADRALLYRKSGRGRVEFVQGPADPWVTLRNADLLLNFDYRIDESIVRAARTTALVDIDPGLLQFWMSVRQIVVPVHDHYLTIGETVGKARSLIPDVGLTWKKIRPAVSLTDWPVVEAAGEAPFTTVSSWWGGAGKGEWVTDRSQGLLYENNKRVTFLEYVELPSLTDSPLELALNLGTGDPDDDCEGGLAQSSTAASAAATDYMGDSEDRAELERHGWAVREARDVAGGPDDYRSYIQASRGEFSCVKPSCIAFQNAWISDRTVCYLASGKPAVIQDTGPSGFLPTDEGLLRFSSIEVAAEALDRVEADYPRHSRAAREIAEEFFDARRIATMILDHTS